MQVSLVIIIENFNNIFFNILIFFGSELLV